MKCLQPIQICPYYLRKDDFMVDKLVSCWIWRNLRNWPIFIFHSHVIWKKLKNRGGGQREDIRHWWGNMVVRIFHCFAAWFLLMLFWKSGQSAHGVLMGRKTEGGSHLTPPLSRSMPLPKLNCLPSARDHSLWRHSLQLSTLREREGKKNRQINMEGADYTWNENK